MELTRPGPFARPNPWVMSLLVLGTAFFCYWPALHGAILWDDPAHITRAELQSWSGLVRIWTDARSTQQYYPVLFSAFWLEHRLWGDSTLGYHVVNVVLHSASACFLALLVRRLWNSNGSAKDSGDRGIPPGAAWFAAFLFVVHPVCVESVAWITEQKNTLSTFFYILAALVYFNFQSRRRRRDYALATVLFLLAVGSKSATTTLPAALLVVIWWKQGTISWRRDVVPLLPWFFIAIGMGLFTSWVERTIIGAEGPNFDLSLMQRGLLAGRVIWFYVLKLGWPVELNFFYPRWNVAEESSGWWICTFAAIGVTAGLWAIKKHARGPLAAWLLFLGSLFPILGFFKVFFFLFSFVNDHFLYLAMLAPIATVSGGSAWLLAGARPATRVLGYFAGVILISLFAVGANRQSALYRDNETLFRATIARNPETWMGHHILGFALAKQPARRLEAIDQFREATRLNPSYPDAHLALAVELSRLPSHKSEAMQEYRRALELRPVYAEAHHGLAVALASEPGGTTEALEHYEAALRYKPSLAEVHANLADLLARLPGRTDEAILHYHETLRLNPNQVVPLCHLAYLLTRIPGRESEAIDHYKAALAMSPAYLDAYNGLAIAYVQVGRIAEAKAEWTAALQIDPNYPAARNNLSRLESMTGN